MATTIEEVKRGEMHVLDASGDTKIMWDHNNRDEVREARAHFDELRRKGFSAFRAEGREGIRGSELREFDPDVERVIMVPRAVGG